MNKSASKKKVVTKDTDESLINACLTNDRKAQIKLYERYAKRLYNVGYRMLKDKMLAEDVMQEAFISAFRKLRNFKQEVPLYSWLRKIVINKSIDEIRRQQVKFTDLKDEQIIDGQTFDGDDFRNNKELIEQVKNELFNLPDGYRVIVSLYYLEGYDHEEISQILNISSSTSRSQLSRAIKVMSKRMTTKKGNNDG